jgi:hypothetical protein
VGEPEEPPGDEDEPAMDVDPALEDESPAAESPAAPRSEDPEEPEAEPWSLLVLAPQAASELHAKATRKTTEATAL